jgi:hypothetical protein
VAVTVETRPCVSAMVTSVRCLFAGAGAGAGAGADDDVGDGFGLGWFAGFGSAASTWSPS